MSTPPITLVPFDAPTLEAAVEGDLALGRALGLAVADGWLDDRDALVLARAALGAGDYWGPFLVVDGARHVVGSAGYFGPPTANGEVEIGYAIAPAHRRAGLATAAVRALTARAFGSPGIVAVVARTRREAVGSMRVLANAGFVVEGEVHDAEGTLVVHRLRR